MKIIAKAITKGDKVVGSLRIMDTIGGEGANLRGVAENIEQLKKTGATDLLINLHSSGGDAFAGLAIYDALKAWDRGTKHVRVGGLAASIASVIAMAGDKVTMRPSAMMMVHEPKAQLGGLFGSLLDLRDVKRVQAKLEACRSTMVNVYAKKTGKAPEEIEKIIDAETWMTAEQAVKNKFADAVEDYEDDEDEDDEEDIDACDRFKLVAEASWANAPEAARALLAFNPDQPRDEAGRFSEDGGSSGESKEARLARHGEREAHHKEQRDSINKKAESEKQGGYRGWAAMYKSRADAHSVSRHAHANKGIPESRKTGHQAALKEWKTHAKKHPLEAEKAAPYIKEHEEELARIDKEIADRDREFEREDRNARANRPSASADDAVSAQAEPPSAQPTAADAAVAATDAPVYGLPEYSVKAAFDPDQAVLHRLTGKDD